MKNQKDTQKGDLKTIEEEREYWEARGPLAEGVKGRINKPVSKENRSSFLSVRLSGKELTQLRDLANQYNLGPSTFAQQMLVALIEKAEAIKTKNETKETKTILFDDLFNEMMKKTTPASRQQILHSLLLSTRGEPEDASSLVMDKSKLRDWAEISIRLISLIGETVNPDIKVITPFDRVYEQEKSTKYRA